MLKGKCSGTDQATMELKNSPYLLPFLNITVRNTLQHYNYHQE